MTASQIAERHIIHRLLRGRRARVRRRPGRALAERLISGLACAAALGLLFLYLPQFVWVLLGAALLVTLGLD